MSDILANCTLLGHTCSQLVHEVSINVVVELIKLALLGSVVGIIVMWFSHRNMMQGRDDGTIAFSLNYINEKGMLIIRPAASNSSIDQLFSTPAMRRAFRKAAAQARKGDGILRFNSPKVAIAIANILKVEITRPFVHRFLEQSVGGSLSKYEFVMVAVRESVGEAVEMTRVIVTPLTMFSGDALDGFLAFEKEYQRDRVGTLKSLRRFFFKELSPEKQINHRLELLFQPGEKL